MTEASRLRIKLFADGADVQSIMKLSADPKIRGFTTNPTLMRKAGITDYEAFGREVLSVVRDRPVSFEVFADDFPTMIAQGLTIASWGDNVNVKIPVTNTKGEFAGPAITALSNMGIVINVTAVLTLDQVRRVAACLNPEAPAIVSVFAGRIADTGVDPVPVMRAALEVLAPRPKTELLWASPRELLNIFQANDIGCHIITATPDVLAKLSLVGRDLEEYSLDTVRMFHGDAAAAGYSIASGPTTLRSTG